MIFAEYAPGPFGPAAAPTDLRRSWHDQIPPAPPVSIQRVEANDPDNPFIPRDNLVTVDRPTVCRIVSASGSLAGTAFLLSVTPWPNPLSVFEPQRTLGWWASRNTFILPAAGDWCIRAQALGVTSSHAVIEMQDATNPELLRTVHPRDCAQNVVGQGQPVIGPGATLLLSNAAVLNLTTLEVINMNTADTIRVGFDAGVAAGSGIPLAPYGQPNDRIRFTSDQIPLAQFWAWKLTAGSIKIIQFI